MPALSIIIPVYNVEATLERCLYSIACQHFTDWEAIVINDGSTDASGTLCDAWARRDARFHVIHQHNHGLSGARNRGLAVATGEHITFVDSDDYLEADTYLCSMRVLNAHPEYDILEFPIVKIYTNGRQELTSFAPATYLKAEDYWLNGTAYLHSYACNKIYRRSLFDGLGFPESMVFEDMHILPLLIRRAQVIASTNQGLYCYTQNPGGITAQAKAVEWASLLEAHINAIGQLGLMERTQDLLLEQYYMHVLNIQLYNCALHKQPPRLPGLHIKHAAQLSPLNFKIKALLLNILGINSLCKLYRIIYPMVQRRS